MKILIIDTIYLVLQILKWNGTSYIFEKEAFSIILKGKDLVTLENFQKINIQIRPT